MIRLSAVKKILQTYIHQYPVIIAVSGGPDSMCLLSICQKVLGVQNIVVAHLDHQIRKNSAQDAQLVEDYCKKYHIRYETTKANVPLRATKEKTSLEESARNVRYSFLREIKIKYHASYILTAHHKDDNIETILLHFIRGAGLRGLKGMQQQTGDLLRPFLPFSKPDLVQYCHKNKIPYHIDHTNNIPDTARNRIRLCIIPEIKKINPHFVETVLHNAQQFADIENWLQQEVKRFLNEEKR